MSRFTMASATHEHPSLNLGLGCPFTPCGLMKHVLLLSFAPARRMVDAGATETVSERSSREKSRSKGAQDSSRCTICRTPTPHPPTEAHASRHPRCKSPPTPRRQRGGASNRRGPPRCPTPHPQPAPRPCPQRPPQRPTPPPPRPHPSRRCTRHGKAGAPEGNETAATRALGRGGRAHDSPGRAVGRSVARPRGAGGAGGRTGGRRPYPSARTNTRCPTLQTCIALAADGLATQALACMHLFIRPLLLHVSRQNVISSRLQANRP